MQRKDFLKLTALGLASIPFASFAQKKGTGKKVIIIGAGMAGAAAAKTLRDSGFEVIVLEARNRVGGRMHTNTDLGINAELGANWVSNADSPDNPILQICNQYNIKSILSDMSSVEMFKQDGDKISKIRALCLYSKLNRKNKQSRAYVEQLDTDISIRQALDKYLDRTKLSKNELEILSVFEEEEITSMACNLEDASAKHYLSSTYTKPFRSEYLVIGGYDSIVKKYLQDIVVQLNEKVVEINQKNNRVEIKTEKNTFEGDYVIITTPISILQNGAIKFNPPLPEFKTKSFYSRKMGLMNKVFMEFEEKFWDNDKHFHIYLSESKKTFGTCINYDYYSKKPILVALPVTESALWAENSSDESVKQFYKNIFHKAFPNKNIDFKNIIKTNWQSDVFSQGSYSYIPIGSTQKDVEALIEPVDRILFAGEATSPKDYGYVHGAYQTGVREATRIINS
jgi:monoamine oxidase